MVKTAWLWLSPFPFPDVSGQWSKWMSPESSTLPSCSILSRPITLVQMEPPPLPTQATGRTYFSTCCQCISIMPAIWLCSYFDGDTPEEDKPDIKSEEEDNIHPSQKKASLKSGRWESHSKWMRSLWVYCVTIAEQNSQICLLFRCLSTKYVKDEPPDTWDEEQQSLEGDKEEEEKKTLERKDKDLEFLFQEVQRNGSLDDRLKRNLQEKKLEPKYKEMLVSSYLLKTEKKTDNSVQKSLVLIVLFLFSISGKNFHPMEKKKWVFRGTFFHLSWPWWYPPLTSFCLSILRSW